MPRHRQHATLRRLAVPVLLLVALLASVGFASASGTFDADEDAPTAAASEPVVTEATDPATPTAEPPTPTPTPSARPTKQAPREPTAGAVVRATPTRADERRDEMADFKEKVNAELRRLEPQVEESSTTTAAFRIGTYNILGSNHAPRGQQRAATSAGFITSRGVDLIGLQEVQPDQQGVFEGNMPGYGFYPDGALGRQDYRKQIAWRTSMFEFVDGGAAYYTFTSMPGIPMPWVRLRHLDTGAELYVVNNHNSARDLEGERDASTGVAINLINELRRSGLPVFIVGDMNEHTEFFCRVAAATGMVAANGGSGSGGCTLPPPPLRVDWIMGVGATFSGYVQDGASIASGASDHYFLHANAAIEVVRTPESAQADR